MSAPTQAFPPWLSPSPVTVTQDGTAVVQSTVIQLPQTYYGPSIPLDSAWVYGGSTFPASIATSFALPAPTLSATLTPSSSQTTATSLASFTSTSSAMSSSSPTQTPNTSSASSSSSLSSSPPSSLTNSSHGISSATRLAIILSTVLGVLLLSILMVVFFRVRRRQQEHRALARGRNFSNWQLVNPSAAHQPLDEAAEEGEGSAFLTDEQGMRERPIRPSLSRDWSIPSSQQIRGGEPTALPNASHSSDSGSIARGSDTSTLDSAAKREALTRFNASASTVAAGSLFFNPARGNDQGNGVRRSDEEPIQEAETSLAATTLPSSQKSYAARPRGAGPPEVPFRSPDRPRIDPQYNLPTYPDPADEQFLPPRRLDPDRVFRLQNTQPSRGSKGSWVYPDSPPSETDERATLLTAQRIDVGSVARPVLASSPSEKSKSLEDFTIMLDVEPVESDDYVVGTPPSPKSWVGMGGLTGFARGLGRLSWFRRMEEYTAGPSGTRHSVANSSPRGAASKQGSRPGSRPASKPGSRPGSGPGSRPGSRPTSGVSLTGPASGNRQYSGLLHPRFAPRPRSDASFHGVDAELGIRPPGIRISGTGSGSGGSGSGKSGGTIYHSVSSRPQTPMYASGVHAYHEGGLHSQPTPSTPPPEFDLGEGDTTIRSVDVLDLPVPERTLPLTVPLRPEPALRPDTASSRGTGLAFPPGLVAVPQWDRSSLSGSSNRRERDVLEDEPPQAGGEWSSLRSKRSSGDEREGGTPLPERRGPVTRNSTGEQAVQVIAGDRATSETASISSAHHRIDPSGFVLQGSPTGPSFNLTPNVSVYASSHSGSGSHSSRPSQHTTSHSHELSRHSSIPESEDGNLLSRGPASHRASLSAMGGESGPPPLPQLRILSPMQTTMESEEESGATSSRPNTGTSRPTMSEATYTGTLASGSASTGAPTTVPSMTGSFEKR